MGRLFVFFCLLFMNFSLIHTVLTALTHSFTSTQLSCHDDEKLALIQFNQSFIINESASSYEGAYPKSSSWKIEGNCCLWDGIKCDYKTGHVISLDLSSSFLFGSINSSSSLFRLVHLQSLNLGDNDFNYSQIPDAIGQFSRMTHLNLSYSTFSGQVPLEISHLSMLSSLDLCCNSDPNHEEKFLELKNPSLRSLVQNLTRLEILDLALVDVQSTVPNFLVNFSSLKNLNLNDCGLYGQFPQKIFHLPNLEALSLMDNTELTGYLPEFHQRSPLALLELAGSGFSGNIPFSISNLNSLKHLEASHCNFSGPIPPSLGKLSQLTFLCLSENSFSGYIPSSLHNLTQLRHLNLVANQLTGLIPSWLGNLSQLSVIGLGENKLHGTFPQWFSKLTNLEKLFLYSNSISGTVHFDMFFNMTSLHSLGIGNNKLSLIEGQRSRNATLSKFIVLGLFGCNLRKFPDFIRYQSKLEWLVLSNNDIHGKIPKWMWNTSVETLSFLALSNNFLTGFDQPPKILPWVCMLVLDLSSNMLQGPVLFPHSFLTARHYDFSDNKLTGEISPLVCNFTSLSFLDLSDNNFSGVIPHCLGNFSHSLQVLRLSNNSFHGTLHVACTNTSHLKMIDFSYNQFQGKLPRSLATCMMLESLDLHHNQIVDVFPAWLGILPVLKLLTLRRNGFYGVIETPEKTSLFPKLQVLDLSYNNFIGDLPFGHNFIWNAMNSINVNELTYMETADDINLPSWIYVNYSHYFSIKIMNKGGERSYAKIPEVFAIIDLSSNKFSGKISQSLGKLKALRSLNLSNNMLTGRIPSSLGDLSDLESLDLSQNRLSGEIPQQLTQLTFLQSFDVSHNNLTGSIPQGNQLRTFENNSFEDNPGLCGNPLSRKCQNLEALPPSHSSVQKDEDEDSESPIEFDWKFALAGFISGLVVGVVLADIVITKRQGWLVKILRIRAPHRRMEIRAPKRRMERERRMAHP